MNGPLGKQHGAALVTSLLMLLVLTVLTISAVSTSSVDLRIAHNIQAQRAVEAAAQQAIEDMLSDSANFRPPLPAPQTVAINDVSVTVPPPTCLGEETPAGYSAGYSVNPTVGWARTHWEVSATATDAVTGARTTLHQGVSIMLGNGNCP